MQDLISTPYTKAIFHFLLPFSFGAREEALCAVAAVVSGGTFTRSKSPGSVLSSCVPEAAGFPAISLCTFLFEPSDVIGQELLMEVLGPAVG